MSEKIKLRNGQFLDLGRVMMKGCTLLFDIGYMESFQFGHQAPGKRTLCRAQGRQWEGERMRLGSLVPESFWKDRGPPGPPSHHQARAPPACPAGHETSMAAAQAL